MPAPEGVAHPGRPCDNTSASARTVEPRDRPALFMAPLLAALAGAAVVLAAGAAGEACAGDAVCSAEEAGRAAAILQDTLGGGEAGVELLQTGRGRREAPVAAGLAVNASLVARAVGEALAARGGNASAPSAEDIEASLRGPYVLAVADVISAAIENSTLPDEAKELARLELKNPSPNMSAAILDVVYKGGPFQLGIFDTITDTLSSAVSSFKGQIQDTLSSQAENMYNKMKAKLSSTAAQTIKDTFGVDVNDLPFKVPGLSCSQDTGGTCGGFFGSSCDSSRNAVCQNDKCVCTSGCAEGGKCT